jgi:hypothetical protein
MVLLALDIEKYNLFPTGRSRLFINFWIIFYMKALSYSFDRELVTVDVQILSTGT